MGLVRLREQILRPAAMQRTLLLFSVVGALVVGLLAMHTIASSGAHGEPAHVVMVAGSVDATTDHGPAAVEDCVGLCGPVHDMSAMACVLAVLVTVVFMAAARRGTLSWLAQPPTSPTRLVFHASLARSLPPPDLNVLSISRT